MAFFNNQRHAGIALTLFALIYLIAGLVTVIIGACGMTVSDTKYEMKDAIAGIGAIIAAILYFGFAGRVMGKASSGKLNDKLGTTGGALNDKFDIIVEFIHVFALAEIIEGIFSIIAGVAGADWGSGVITVIIGLIVLFLYKKVTDGKEGLIDKIVWIILLILFLLTILAGIGMLLGIITIPLGIALIIIGVFMFMALLDNDVKAKFGM